MSRESQHKILGLFWDFFRRDSGYFGGGGREGALSAVGGGPTGGFEVQPSTPVPCAPDSPSLLTTEGKHPRGSRGPDEGDHYLLKSCIPAIKVDSTLTGRTTYALISLEMPAPGILTYMNGGLEHLDYSLSRSLDLRPQVDGLRFV